MSAQDFINNCLNGYLSIIKAGLPVAFFIAACNVSFNIIFTAFSGGGLSFGRGDRK